MSWSGSHSVCSGFSVDWRRKIKCLREVFLRDYLLWKNKTTKDGRQGSRIIEIAPWWLAAVVIINPASFTLAQIVKLRVHIGTNHRHWIKMDDTPALEKWSIKSFDLQRKWRRVTYVRRIQHVCHTISTVTHTLAAEVLRYNTFFFFSILRAPQIKFPRSPLNRDGIRNLARDGCLDYLRTDWNLVKWPFK